MHQLTDSFALKADQAALRRRLAEDGYLFLRGLLPAGDVRAAHEGVHAELSRGEFTDEHGHPTRPRPAGIQELFADPSFRAALFNRAINRLPYLAPLRGLIRLILGPTAFSYPAKVLRIVFPERPGQVAQGRHIHQDFTTSGVQDMLTTWLPLMDIPTRLGGLGVLPGSHLGPPLPSRLLRDDERGWATTDYKAGDVVVFHCMTTHAALPNRTDSLRVSIDCRWQVADQPAPAEMVYGPAATRDGSARQNPKAELFGQLFNREPWWEPVPSGLIVQPRQQLIAVPPAQSWLFPVHPDWQRWCPPTEPVY